MWDVTAADGSTFVMNTDDISHWANICADDDPQRGRQYRVYPKSAPTVPIATVRYLLDFPDTGILTIADLEVDTAYQNMGVALALLVTLHAAYPDHKINPGAASEVGKSFTRHLSEAEPEVFADTIILAHPSLSNLLSGDGADPEVRTLDASGDGGGTA